MRLNPKEIIRTLKANGGKIRLTARQLGVSPGTVRNWKVRATSIHGRLKLSTRGLTRKSTRPQTTRGTTIKATDQDAIIALRKQSNFGAIKLTYLLGLPYPHRTVHRFLKYKGLIPEQTRYRRPRGQPTTHMHAKNVTKPGYLQMDVKYVTPQLSGLPHTLFEYALIDIYSRYKIGLIVPALDCWSTISVLEAILQDLPFPVHFIQTDNGLEFQREFLLYLEKKGIQHHFVHKQTPNENAVIERSFRTDEDEFFFWHYRKAKDLMDLNNQFHQYLYFYNTERPHLSLDLMTPVEKLKSYQAT